MPLEDNRPHRPHRPRRLIHVAAGALAAGSALAVVVFATVSARGGGTAENSPSQPIAVNTVAVVRTDLSTSYLLHGSLGYGPPQAVKGGHDGVVTWLPEPGRMVGRGQVLYRVNDDAVSLFIGSPPLYRTLSERNTVGRDVAMVADNLKALGYAIGKQPKAGAMVEQSRAQSTDGQTRPGAITSPTPGAPGGASPSPKASSALVTVHAGDGVLTTSLISAIKKWQHDSGLPEDGRLAVGGIAVLPGPVRVDAVTAQVGDSAVGSLMSVTQTTRVVTVQAQVTEAASLKRGDAATLRLPDGTQTPGKVDTIATVAQSTDQQTAGNGGQQTMAVTVTLNNQHAVGRLTGGDVDVNVAGETHSGVLAVPVTTLLALREGGYALQLADNGLLAVKTGLFARGMVEVTGDGLRAGLKVVTTS
jgi:hypothetical protein